MLENDGERQVAPDIEDIRKDHVARYRFAAERMADKRVLDVGCGVGYGAWVMAEAGARVKAADVDEDAIDYARQHYAHEKVEHVAAAAENLGPFQGVDAAVMFEVIEHLEDPLPALKRVNQTAAVLYASVPNELVFPYKGYKYHYRHYTPEEFEGLLNKAGYEVREWWGQAGPESDCERDVQGRTLIAVAERVETIVGGMHKLLPEAPRPVPAHVAIVAMGASARTYVTLCAQRGSRRRVADETWAINSMGDCVAHDLLFHMDDCKVQERRAAARPDGNIAGLMDWLRRHPRFLTSKVYPDYPGAVAFPLQEVIRHTGSVYLNNTVAFAVAYAMWLGVKKISLFGCDYSYENLHKAERGRGCVEFLLGLAAARGIQVEVAQDSSLLDANVPDDQRLYGYDAYDVSIEVADGKVAVHMAERDELPSADEIERRYCHEVPPTAKKAA